MIEFNDYRGRRELVFLDELLSSLRVSSSWDDKLETGMKHEKTYGQNDYKGVDTLVQSA